MDIIANSTFKTIDYTYLKQDGDDLIAYVQATFGSWEVPLTQKTSPLLSQKKKRPTMSQN